MSFDERRKLGAVGDFNGDGIPDLICAAAGYDLFIGNGDGTFGLPTLIEPLGSYHDVGQPLPVDLNGDGNMDIVGQKPKSGLPDLVVPDSSGELDVIFNTTPK